MEDKTQFGKALKDGQHPFQENGIEYYYPFINQYIKIPDSIMDKVNNDYSTKKAGVRYCIALILTNLIKRGIVAYSRSNRYYQDRRTKYFTKTNLLCAVDLVKKDGYAFTRPGSKNIKYDKGIASRLFPLDKINELPKTFEASIDFSKFPLLEIDGDKIYSLRDLNKYVTSASPLSPTPTTISLSSHSLSHNGNIYAQTLKVARRLNRKYFNKMVLDFTLLPDLRFIPLNKVGLTRVFNSNECGRWYQLGGLSYQQLSENERSKILLNGSEVAELDYSAMHPHILYAWEGRQCPDNFYEMIAEKLGVEYNQDTKFVIKRVTLSAINASSEVNLKKAILYDKHIELRANDTRRKEGRAERPILSDELKRLAIDFKDIVEAFKRAHPIIAKYIYSNSANRLMLTESEVMTKVLCSLMYREIPSVPIHDSVLFQKHYKDVVRQVMLDNSQKVTGFKIIVK
jgi:hypothetical protein